MKEFIFRCVGYVSPARKKSETELVTSSHSSEAVRFQFLRCGFQQAPGTGGERFPGVRIVKAHQVERHIVLPRNSPEGAQIRNGNDIVIAILLVANL